MALILQGLTAQHTQSNPYLRQLIDVLESLGADVKLWSWKEVWRLRPDAVHIHWPEIFYTGKTLSRGFVKGILFIALLLKWRLLGSQIVWTVHNLAPHEGLHRSQRCFDFLLRRLVTDVIILNEDPARPKGLTRNVRTFVVLHGDYKAILPTTYAHESVPGSIIAFGHVRPYKGIEQLIDGFKVVSTSNNRLRIIGQSISKTYADELHERADADDRICFVDRFVSDEELATLISESSLVVLPYRRMYNSGAAILALSCDRPVFMPRTIANEALKDELGNNWVTLYDPPFTKLIAKRAMDLSWQLPDGRPDLSKRSWTDQITSYSEIFRFRQLPSGSRK